MIRSLLIAGATRPDLVAKLPRSRPDVAVVDLEDAVPAEHKRDARSAARELALELAGEHPEQALYVRVNGVETEWFADDVASALASTLRGVLVPKVEDAAQIVRVRAVLVAAGHAELAIVAGIESARGVAHVEEIFGAGPDAAYFGAEDYAADLGGRRSPGGLEVLYARSRVALAARVAGVPAIDQVVVDVRDLDAFRADAALGRDLGYRGKVCIHPAQVALANEVFGATPAEAARAEQLIATWERSAAEGVGVAVFDGAMIDEPALRMARETLARARASDETRSVGA